MYFIDDFQIQSIMLRLVLNCFFFILPSLLDARMLYFSKRSRSQCFDRYSVKEHKARHMREYVNATFE